MADGQTGETTSGETTPDDAGGGYVAAGQERRGAEPSFADSPDDAAAYRERHAGPGTLRHVDWASALPFTRLFRGFRVATHPSKLLLALALVLLAYTLGRALDAVWPGEYRAVAAPQGQVGAGDRPNEIDLYELAPSAGVSFADVRADNLRGQRAAYDQVVGQLRAEPLPDGTARPADARVSPGDVKDFLLRRRDAAVQVARGARDAEVRALKLKEEAADDADDEAAEDLAEDQIDLARDRFRTARRAAYVEAERAWRAVDGRDGVGPFDALLDYESRKIDDAAASVAALDLFGERGLAASLFGLLFVGPAWLVTQHPVYAALFLIPLLAMVAVFGGAISRIAAVDVARDEKISLRQALKFSAAKFLSFFSAPLIPLAIFALIGLALSVAGLLTNIPYAGPVVVGGLFVFALLAGLVMTLILIGTVGGFGMMYPTVAVEGSDSFDAISRSFSYLYARPWRLIFYSLVALAYGALTYLFVKFFLFLVIRLALRFTGLFVWNTAGDGTNVLDKIAPGPAGPMSLAYDIDFITLNPAQDVAAGLAAFWIYLTVALAAAYLISLYFSLNTIIYYLMRREVDATETDEVYLDPADDEFADNPPESPSPEPLTPAADAPSDTPAGATVGVYPDAGEKNG